MINIHGETILNSINNGVIILNENLKVLAWNKWLEIFTNTKEDEIVGKYLHEVFSYINEKKLKRKVKSVLVTNSPSFYAKSVNKYLIDIPVSNITNQIYSSMQQDVTVVPYDIEKKQVALYIYDTTTLCEFNNRLEVLNKELEDMSHRDPMTGLFNRRYFAVQSEKIKSYAQRNNLSLCVIILDIDKFKNINDTYGHMIGDEAIIATARALENALRKSDIVARFGGEEFVLLLQDCCIENGNINIIAEKIREDIEAIRITTDQGELSFTASLGVAQFDEKVDEDNLEHTLSRADHALYEAKQTGRNKTVITKP
jgi:diguanylate cyclase (GGDEF)-like protein